MVRNFDPIVLVNISTNPTQKINLPAGSSGTGPKSNPFRGTSALSTAATPSTCPLLVLVEAVGAGKGGAPLPLLSERALSSAEALLSAAVALVAPAGLGSHL